MYHYIPTPGLTPVMGTVDYYKHIHYLTRTTELPLGVHLGPFLFLGRPRRPHLYKIVSRFAFWLLRFVGWEVVSSGEAV